MIYTGISKECAIVEYQNLIEAEEAIRILNNTTIKVHPNFSSNSASHIGRMRKIIVREDRGDGDLLKFHKTFCESQFRASKFAEVFNKKLLSVPGLANAPRISFLECSVYIVNGVNGRTAMLVEKQLNPKLYKKWNTNNGTVDGHTDVEKLQGPIDLNIVEGCEDEEEEDELNSQANAQVTFDPVQLQRDIPQAFSCFTYRFTKRKMLVCDLQGVLDISQSPPLFELTDPAIHYTSRSGQSGVLQCVLYCVKVCCSVLQCVAVCCMCSGQSGVLQFVTVYCSVWQDVVVCCSVFEFTDPAIHNISRSVLYFNHCNRLLHASACVSLGIILIQSC